MIAAIATAAWVIGAAINVTLVPGDYEWLGILRIFRDVSHRPGFWLLCLLCWLAGTEQGPAERKILQGLSLLKRSPAWRGVLAAVVVAGFLAGRQFRPGSPVDLAACSLLLTGLLFNHLTAGVRLNSRLSGEARLVLASCLFLVGYTLVGYGHTMAKGMLFVVASPVDAVLSRIDSLFLGVGVYERMAEFRVAFPTVTRLLDLSYIGLLAQHSWVFFYLYGTRDARQARLFALALFSLYTLGSLAYFAAPSMGPLFSRSGDFSDLGSLAPDSIHLGTFLMEQTNLTNQGLSHAIAPFGFIAAMPSLHVGISLVMFLSMRRSLPMTMLNLFMLVMTILSTSILGWHYVLDDIAGVVLGWLCWRLAGAYCAQEAA